MAGTAGAQDETDIYPAEGVDWRLDALFSNGALADVPADVVVTLLLSGGDATGSAGCNSYFGSYAIDATSLRFPEPFASTREFCEGAAQVTEDAYFPLLEAVAGWTVDAEGVLSLSDASGSVTLVYSQAPRTTAQTDVEDLAFELDSLQNQLDDVEQEIAALGSAIAAVDIERLDRRITGNRNAISGIDTTIGRFRNRIERLEAAVAGIDTTIGKFRNRINRLEDASAGFDARLVALESLVPASE